MRLKLLRFARVWLLMGLGCVVGIASATSEPQRIYRCGNAYTNQPDPEANCKPLAGASVTVVEGTKVQGPQAVAPSQNASGGMPRLDSAEQRRRDAQAQTVLQAELQKALQQQADLLREWNNGEPDRRADELRQPQKYQDRVVQLRGALQRAEADVAGLQRELSRMTPAMQTGGKP